MKNILKAGFLALTVLLFSGCSDDDKKNPWNIVPGPPVGVEITYKVTASSSMIREISYKMGNGTLFYGSLNPESPNTWSKVLVALYHQMPVNAFLQAKCRNTSSTPQTFTISLLNGTTVLDTQTTTVPPADDDADLEDDTVTLELNKLIDE